MRFGSFTVEVVIKGKAGAEYFHPNSGATFVEVQKDASYQIKVSFPQEYQSNVLDNKDQITNHTNSNYLQMCIVMLIVFL
jgi:hypothetical protein